MYLYVFGGGLGNSAQNNILLYSSLGNLQSKNLEFSTQLVAQRDTQFESKRVEQYLSYFRIVIWSDFVYSLLLICFFLWWRKYKDSISNHVENVVNSPAKFALEISNIPSDTTEEELRDFLSKRYPYDFINQINFAFRFNNTLSYFMKLSDLEIEKKIVRTNNENQTTTQLRSKLIQLDRKIAQTEANLRNLMPHLQESKGANGMDQKLDLNGLEKLKAFVLFEKSSSARSVKIDYDRRVHNLGWFGTLDQKYLFRSNQKLDLAFPDYPDNIKWENLEIGGCNKVMRVLATTTATILVMVVCFIAILFLNIGSSVAESVKLDCPDRVNTINEISILPKDAPNYALVSQCFCKSQSVFTIIRNDQVNEICSSYLRSSILTNLLSIAGGLAIAVTNFGLKQLLRWFTKFEKFKDLTSECSSLVTFGLIAAYVNTVVVTILSSAEFPNGYIPSQVIASMAGFNANDIPTYTDFSRESPPF